MNIRNNGRRANMTIGNKRVHSKCVQAKCGFISFDLLFCILPLLLMLSFLMHQAWIISETTQTHLDTTETYAKLLSIADYAVKQGGAQKENQQGGQFSGSALYRPNSIDETELSKIPVDRIRGWMELTSLHIGWEKGEGTCIYRIVLRGNEVKKLYVCGE